MTEAAPQPGVEAYLRRIRYGGGLAPTAETLAALQRAHLLTVPFENLDIGRGVPIALDPASLHRKIVERRRGGFCYELNGLFHRLLLSLGFRSTMVSARVFDRPRGTFGPEFDHMALVVAIDGADYLSDVGFGDFSPAPLAIGAGRLRDDTHGAYRFATSAAGRTVVERRRPDGGFDPQYDFTGLPRQLGEFAEMCRYHQTSPDSHFTRQRVCSMATPGGRITLMPDRFIETADGVRTETPVAGEDEYRDLLERRFGIRL